VFSLPHTVDISSFFFLKKQASKQSLGSHPSKQVMLFPLLLSVIADDFKWSP